MGSTSTKIIKISFVFFNLLLDILFPPRCLSCKHYVERGAVLCVPCAENIVLHSSLFCGVCRARLPDASKTCHKKCPYILGAAADYQNKVVQAVIRGVKFELARKGAGFLGEMLARYAEDVSLPRADAILPIPLGARRKRERGFNQSELIAHALGNHLSIPVVSSALIRTKNTKPQTQFSSHEERFRNIANSFSVRDTNAVMGKTIILVDDVTTSGATFHDAARALHASGAKKIFALAAAKALSLIHI